MAIEIRDMNTLLNTIATATKGKDMRSAIHDALELCYSDATSEHATKNNPQALTNNTNLNSVTDSSAYLLLTSNAYSNLPPGIDSSSAPAAFLFTNTVGGWTIQIVYTWDDGPIWKRRGQGSSGTWERWIDLTQNDKLNAISAVMNILLAGVEDQYKVNGTVINSSSITEQARLGASGDISMLSSGGALYKVFEYSVDPSRLIFIDHAYRSESVEYCFLDVHNNVINKQDLSSEEYFNDPVHVGSVDVFKRTRLVVVPYDAVKLRVSASTIDGSDAAKCLVKYVSSIEGSSLYDERFDQNLSYYSAVNGSELSAAQGVRVEKGYKYASDFSYGSLSYSAPTKRSNSSFSIYWFDDLTNVKRIISQFSEPDSSIDGGDVHLICFDANDNRLVNYLNGSMSNFTDPEVYPLYKDTDLNRYVVDVDFLLKKYPAAAKIGISVKTNIQNGSWTVEYYADTTTPIPYPPSYREFKDVENRVTALEESTDGIEGTADRIPALVEKVTDLKYLDISYVSPSSISYAYGQFSNDTDGSVNSQNTAVRFSSNVSVKAGSTISCDEGYEYRVGLFSGSSSSTFISKTAWISDGSKYVVEDDCYVLVCIREYPTPISHSDFSIKSHLHLELISGGTTVKDGVVSVTSAVEDSNDRVDLLSAALSNGYTANHNAKSLWEPGYITVIGANGSTSASDHLDTIRTITYLDDSITTIKALSGTFKIFEYENGTFKRTRINLEEFSDFETGRQYRISYQCGSNAVEEHYKDILLVSSDSKLAGLGSSDSDLYSSRFNRHSNVVLPPYDWFCAGLSDYSYGTASTTTAQLYSKFSELASAYSSALTVRTLGTGTGGFAVNCYSLNHDSTANIPKILIVCAQQGYEKGSSFGAYYLLKDILKNHLTNDYLGYLYSNVELDIVPIANGYGFANNQFKNGNGVNLNRNWETDAFEVVSSSLDEYGGETAGSEPEVRAIKTLFGNGIRKYDLIIDFHTSGRNSAASWLDANRFETTITKDYFADRISDVASAHLQRLTEVARLRFGCPSSNAVGTITSNTPPYKSSLSYYGIYSQETIGIIFEGANGLPGSSAFSDLSKKWNEEILANFLFAYLNEIRPNNDADIRIINTKLLTLESKLELLTNDIRAGENGITYSSAGDAVRSQFAELKTFIMQNLSNVITDE